MLQVSRSVHRRGYEQWACLGEGVEGVSMEWMAAVVRACVGVCSVCVFLCVIVVQMSVLVLLVVFACGC